MSKKTITNDIVADAVINVSEMIGICDKDTAIGMKTSKKKDILLSNKEGSFSKFTQEIKKKQDKKDWKM